MKKITIEEFDKIYEIMKEAFPADERRSEKCQREIFDEKDYTVVSNSEMSTFIAFWELESFVYIEHFATESSQRGHGGGGKFLDFFLAEIDKPVVLEVEPPAGKIEKRRVKFYERHGFKLNNYFYMQPPYGEGKAPLELKIMTYPEGVSESEFEALRDEIHKKVYKC